MSEQLACPMMSTVVTNLWSMPSRSEWHFGFLGSSCRRSPKVTRGRGEFGRHKASRQPDHQASSKIGWVSRSYSAPTRSVSLAEAGEQLYQRVAPAIFQYDRTGASTRDAADRATAHRADC